MTNVGPFDLDSYVVGDCRELLAKLPDDSIDCVVTSPPYWGLRDYGLPPAVWGGPPECSHEWGDGITVHKGGTHGNGVMLAGGRSVVDAQALCKDIDAGAFCRLCGAWRGCLGLEPTYQLYVDHMVQVFRCVHRVLKPEGTCWLNLGDCYATFAYSAKSPGGGEQGDVWRGVRGERMGNGRGDQPADGRNKSAIGPMSQPNRKPQPGLKPKDLVMIPHRVAIALQEDGWWVRQCNIWDKPSAMPESVSDRTTTSHEYVFQLAKSQDYFYDAKAIMEECTGNAHPRGRGVGPKSVARDLGIRSNESFNAAVTDVVTKRNKRSVWRVAPEPLKDAHFAAFPTKLVRPCVLAGCPAGGVVLDPFGGSGTVGRVAEDTGRHWLLFDLSPSYAGIAKRRTAQTGLLARCAP